ncbi:DUF302 domain-containing protein [Agrobacterium tumefaciens]|uniref:Uncharacterized protein (DUF302 family) n=1 Tax=Agrobacterium tumefaciens TaxID=358 RepID=A0AAW8M096_AGRTU|nr:DUF302 domain-containing protein [Agrobacterium tumefaciens]MBP2542222.1 uncharacterized protein (DUF302 family) [Agrobacterium tumefaciens]MBP2568070.1 uncharacterized protein (DUF302 family) [Agrobacterium tumefaciens]MDP9874178.1 uncharacterized protein (DUF302 family) [Agrobacterium tumefaciens]MDP9978774.1 uncharacterized protein (DUF302 family) [Agrobacterium tumefaciens]MDR6704833.1 uncharacterized protein (DUF302 family) [Agrobacterium tumefaciens]
MTYTLDKTIKGLPFDDMVAAAKVALAMKGFGVLPCNVIVRSLENGTIMVSAIDPVASMQAIDNPHLKTVAGQVRSAVAAI